MMTEKALAAVAEQIKKCNKAAIFCHIRPDGDALGSGLGLCLAMRSAGKDVCVVCEDRPPEKFSFLESMTEVSATLPDGQYDAFIAVDCSDTSRLGVFDRVFSSFKGMTINIDHHVSNKNFAKINYVGVCAATCELMPNILEAASLELTRPIANLLMLGIVTDSGSFSHSDVTPHTFEAAAKLTAAGADVHEISYRMFSCQKKERAALYCRVMSTLRFALDDKLAFIFVSDKNIKETGADVSMTEGFVDFPLSIDGVEVAISVLEMKKGQYKASLRSKGKADVNAIAGTFGGGGHALASGCMLFGEYEEVVDRLTYAVYQHL